MVWRGPMVTQALEQLLKRHELARPRLPDRRHAARHRRHPAHARAAGAGHRRGDRHDAAGHRAARRAQGPQDVREGRRADRSASSRTWRCTSARTAATPSTSSARAAASACAAEYGVPFLGSAAARHPHPRAGRLRASRRSSPIPTARVARRVSRRSRRKVAASSSAQKAEGLLADVFPNIVVQNT